MLERLQPHTVKIYDLENKEFEVIKIRARQLLRADRFDLFAKLLYVRLRQTEPDYAARIYDEHIKAFNPDLKEPGREDKNSLDDFRQTFDKLIDCFAEKNFDAEQSVIPLSEDYTLLDGAHRVAALAYFDKEVTCLHFKDVTPKCRFDYLYFRNRGLAWDACDSIAFEMVKWLPNIHVACLWPRMKSKAEALRILQEKYCIGYVSQMKVSLQSMIAFTELVYKGQPWVTNQASVEDKAMQCFGFGCELVFVFFTADNLEDVLSTKDKIRKYYGLDKHALHITDNAVETLEVADLVLTDKGKESWCKEYGAMSKFISLLSERWLYFRKVQIINLKVFVAKLINLKG